jgi:A/G-specific adenine glycosylase
LLPRKDLESYTQGLMDLGATLCTRVSPKCGECPMHERCVARRDSRTHLLPGARPRRAVPVKSATWLVLRHAGRVLLQKRPGVGLWGGLWTFPELEGEDAGEYCMQALGCRIGIPAPMDPLEHAFTHFRLRVRPLLCEVAKLPHVAQAPGRMWIDPGEAAGAALPAPVKALLAGLASEKRVHAKKPGLPVGQLQ